MRCGSCGWDNPAGIVFCTNCGKRGADGGVLSVPAQGQLAPQAAGPAATRAYPSSPTVQSLEGPLSCRHCGAASAPGLRFCRDCGAAISAATPPPPAIPPASFSTAYEGQQYPRSFEQPSFGQSPSMAVAGRLVMLLRDGSEGRTIALSEGDTDIGAREGSIVFEDDPYLSPRHARISCRSGAYMLRDLDSVNGVYVRLRDVQELRDRDMILLGQQVLRFEVLLDGELPLGPAFQGGVLVFGTPEVSRFARLVQYTTEGVGRDVHYLFRDETVVGRENGDIVFTDDPFLSRRHAAIRADQAGRRFTLHDLGSSNGTAIRIRGEHVLRDGDQFRLGRHLFRFEAGPSGGRS